VLEYPFAIPAEIYLSASFHQPPYTEQNGSALRTQQLTRRQIDSTSRVR